MSQRPPLGGIPPRSRRRARGKRRLPVRLVRGVASRARNVLRRPWGRLLLLIESRPMDVFVVTYPKSGTNWVGYFLASVLADRHTGGRHALDLDSFREWVPDINTEFFGRKSLHRYTDLPNPRIFTVHAPYTHAFGRIVYIVRDPRDVMVSYYYHYRREDPDFDLPIDRFVRENDAWPGDWGAHVRGWLRRAGRDDLLLVRYEDLKCDPRARFVEIAAFCGLHLSEAELDDYVDRASFGNMARVEPGRAHKEVPFMRKGRTGDWREELSADSVRRIEQRYRPLMEKLGYELCHGTGHRAEADDAGRAPGMEKGTG